MESKEQPLLLSRKKSDTAIVEIIWPHKEIFRPRQGSNLRPSEWLQVEVTTELKVQQKF